MTSWLQPGDKSANSSRQDTLHRRLWDFFYYRVIPYTRPDDLCVLVFSLTVIVLFLLVDAPFEWLTFWYFTKPLFYWVALLAPLSLMVLIDERYSIRKSTSRLVRGAAQVLRDFVPYLICLVIYLNLADVVHLVNPHDKDALLIAIDQTLFRVQLSVWLEQFSNPWLDEWMRFTYQIFGLYPITLGLFFLARGERRNFRDILLAIIMTSYAGYLGYMMVPAVGPRYHLEYSVDLQGRFFAAIDFAMKNAAMIPRDCFPSLHTANTLVSLGMAWRYRRGLFWVYLPLCASTVIATVYLRYHYVIDVVAGALLAWAVVRLAPRWNDVWDGWTGRISQQARKAVG